MGILVEDNRSTLLVPFVMTYIHPSAKRSGSTVAGSEAVSLRFYEEAGGGGRGSEAMTGVKLRNWAEIRK